MANWIEVELKIAGTLVDNEKLLLSQGFILFYKRHIMTNYYLPPNVSMDEPDLKSKCIRIRKSIRLDTNGTDIDGISLMNAKGEPDDKSNLRQEKKLLKQGYTLLFTDDKLDWVLKDKNFDENRIVFQLQQIAGIGLIVAYDNRNYYDTIDQRERLIKDIENTGIKILDYENVDRFSIIKNKDKLMLSFNEVVDKLNKEKNSDNISNI